MSEQDATLDDFADKNEGEKQESEPSGLREEGFLTLPYDWSISTVDEVATENGLVDGDWIESDDMDEDGEIQLVQLAHIGEGRFKGEPDRFITEEFAEEENCTILSEGDLLISRMQEPILRSCLLPSFERDSVMAVDIARLEHTDDWNRHFLKFLFNSRPIWKQGIAWASGTTRKRISRTNMEKLRVPAPPLEEQRKIASVLYIVDQVIQKTEQVIKKLKTIQEGLYREIYRYWTDRTETDPLVGEYPESWTLKELSDVTTITDAEHFTPDYTDSGIPVLRPGDLSPGRISLDDVEKRVDEDTYAELTQRYTPTNDDIVYSRSQNFAVAGRVIEDRRYCIGQDMVVIETGDLDREFLLHLLNSPLVRNQAIRMSTGSTFSRVNLGDIRSYKVPIPDKHVQQEIGGVFDSIEEQLICEKTYKKQIQYLKYGLMQDLLSGEVRTHDKDIELVDDVLQHG